MRRASGPVEPETLKAVPPDGGAAGEWQREVVRFSDLRMLVPALAAWALLAGTLTWGSSGRWAMATALVVAALVLALWRRRRPGALLVVSVALLLQVAANGQHALRSVGDLDDLTAARAVVTVEVTITSDPFTPASRAGREPVVLARATAYEVEGRGHGTRAHAPVLLRGETDLLEVRGHERVRVRGEQRA